MRWCSLLVLFSCATVDPAAPSLREWSGTQSDLMSGFAGEDGCGSDFRCGEACLKQGVTVAPDYDCSAIPPPADHPAAWTYHGTATHPASSATVHVHGYTTKSGKHVKSYTRHAPSRRR